MRYIYQGHASDANGAVIPSATIDVFLAGTSTAASIYTASSGGSAVNSVTADATTGYFSFYVDDADYDNAQTFKITITKANHATQTYNDVVIFASGTELTTKGDILTNDGTNDVRFAVGNDGDMLVADASTATGLTWRNLGWVDVRDYGAVGDGVTDDTTAIQNAINSITLSGIVFFPAGTYKISSALSIPTQIILMGVSHQGSIISGSSTTQNILLLGGAYIQIRNLKLTRSVTATAGAGIALNGVDANYTRMKNVYIEKQFYGVDTSNLSTQSFINSVLEDVICKDNISIGWRLNAPRGIFIRCQSMQNGGVGFDVYNDTGAAVAGMEFINCIAWNNNGNGMQFRSVTASDFLHDIFMTHNSFSKNNGHNLYFLNYGDNIQVVNTFSEYAGKTVSWTDLNTGHGLRIDGNCNYVEITNFDAYFNSENGVLLNGNTTNINMNGGLCINNGRAVAGTTSQCGIRIVGCENVNVTGMNINDNSPGTQLYGISFGTGNNYLNITGNMLRGNATSAFTYAGTNYGLNSIIENNITGESVTVASAATIAIPFGTKYVELSGTTNVSTINGGFVGREVTLKTDGILTFNDGVGNLDLAGNFVTTTNDVLKIAYNGTNWYEVSRSVN